MRLPEPALLTHARPAARSWALGKRCTCPKSKCRPQFEQTKAMENESAEQKQTRAPRTFGIPGAANHVTMNLHGIDDGRSVEDVSPTRRATATQTTSVPPSARPLLLCMPKCSHAARCKSTPTMRRREPRRNDRRLLTVSLVQCDASLRRGRLRCARSHAAVHGTSMDNPMLYAFDSLPRPSSAPLDDRRRAPYSASVAGRKMFNPAGVTCRILNNLDGSHCAKMGCAGVVHI